MSRILKIAFIALAAAVPYTVNGEIIYVTLVDDTWQICELDTDSLSVKVVTSDEADKKSTRWVLPEKDIIYSTSEGNIIYLKDKKDARKLLTTIPHIMDEPIMVDENRILFIRFAELRDNSDLWVSDPLGKHPKKLTNLTGFIYSADCHPRSREVLLSIGAKFRDAEIYLLDGDWKAIEKLTDNKFYDFYPRWSPDGSRIAFVSDRNGNYDIWIMNKDGKNQEAVTAFDGIDDQPTWSPDGKSIAFISNRSGSMQIWIKSLEDGSIKQVTDGDGPAAYPDWK